MTTPERTLEISPGAFAEIAHALRQPAYDEVFGNRGAAHAAEAGRIVMTGIVLALKKSADPSPADPKPADPRPTDQGIAAAEPDLGTPGLGVGPLDSGV